MSSSSLQVCDSVMPAFASSSATISCASWPAGDRAHHRSSRHQRGHHRRIHWTASGSARRSAGAQARGVLEALGASHRWPVAPHAIEQRLGPPRIRLGGGGSSRSGPVALVVEALTAQQVPAREHLPQHHAERIDVRAPIGPPRAAAGRHVAQLAEHRSDPRAMSLSAWLLAMRVDRFTWAVVAITTFCVLSRVHDAERSAVLAPGLVAAAAPRRSVRRADHSLRRKRSPRSCSRSSSLRKRYPCTVSMG